MDRRRSDPCRLVMMLPANFAALAPPGPHRPCLHGCLLTIGRGGMMTIEGPSREQVFAQADRFLRSLIRRNPPPPMSIAATVTSPCGTKDGWQVVINAEISFAPTPIEATIVEQIRERAENVVRLDHGPAR